MNNFKVYAVILVTLIAFWGWAIFILKGQP